MSFDTNGVPWPPVGCQGSLDSEALQVRSPGTKTRMFYLKRITNTSTN